MALTYDLKSGLAAVKRSAMWAKLRVLSVFYQLDARAEARAEQAEERIETAHARRRDGSPAQRGA